MLFAYTTLIYRNWTSIFLFHESLLRLLERCRTERLYFKFNNNSLQ